jgi:hydrogenase-1 operon protein HyaF
MSAEGGRTDTGLIAPRSGNAKALLREIHQLLAALAAGKAGGAIDLRALPLTQGDFDELRAVLGDGAVEARIQALGESIVRETRFPGIWWVTHCNEAGETVAELIEIAAVPLILCTPAEDVSDGLVRFERALDGATGAVE